MQKVKDPIRARKRRTDRVQQNLNALQVAVITKPLEMEVLDILVDLTGAALKAVMLLEEREE